MKWALASLVFQITVFIAVRNLFPEGIFFYQGVAVALAGAIFQLALLSRLRKPEPTLHAALAFFMGYSFFFTIPTTVDRAYSVKFLQALHEKGSMDAPQVEQWFTRDLAGSGAIDKRLREQTATGTIRSERGKYILTPRGVFFARAFGAACRLFNCRNDKASARKN